MTNGEKIKEIFPNGVLTSINNSYYWGDDILVSKEWWNAEYKEPTTKKDCNTCTHNNETDGSNCYECVKDMCNNYEPATKNDLGVDCISREDVLMCLTGEFENREYEPSELIKIFSRRIKALPSVKPQLSSELAKNSQTLEKNFGESDCISRAEVLKLIYDYKENHSENRNEYPINYGTLLDIIRWVINLPSVTPQEPKTGHWIPTYGNVKCSVCGSVKDSRDVGKATHYCDFCGAKMVEPQESKVEE